MRDLFNMYHEDMEKHAILRAIETEGSHGAATFVQIVAFCREVGFVGAAAQIQKSVNELITEGLLEFLFARNDTSTYRLTKAGIEAIVAKQARDCKVPEKVWLGAGEGLDVLDAINMTEAYRDALVNLLKAHVAQEQLNDPPNAELWYWGRAHILDYHSSQGLELTFGEQGDMPDDGLPQFGVIVDGQQGDHLEGMDGVLTSKGTKLPAAVINAFDPLDTLFIKPEFPPEEQ